MAILQVIIVIMFAVLVGKLVTLVKLPSILGWLIAGMVFGPHLCGVVTADILDANAYKIVIKVFECFAGVMIGGEIVFKKLRKFGSKIVVITLFQSLSTFAVVTAVFAVVFAIAGVPLYLAAIFGGIALATAPAPALSIVNEFKTRGPVTDTLIPMAALDDVVGVVVFFTVISVVSSTVGSGGVAVWSVVLMVLLPFIIGIAVGVVCGFIMRKIKKRQLALAVMMAFLGVCIVLGLVCDKFIFKSFSINYLLIGMAFSAAVVNIVPTERMEEVLRLYNPLLTLSLVVVIVNLGMPLDYKLIAGAGLYTVVYILSRAVGKIGGAAVGGVAMKAEATVKKYLGLTLLPHSGVSLVFTGISVGALATVAPECALILQGTIAAAAIINEIIAVILAQSAFNWAGEIQRVAPRLLRC